MKCSGYCPPLAGVASVAIAEDDGGGELPAVKGSPPFFGGSHLRPPANGGGTPPPAECLVLKKVDTVLADNPAIGLRI